MQASRKAYLELHIAVLLFGFTAILGSLIDLPAISLVWWRVFITSLSLLLLVNVKRLFANHTFHDLTPLIIIGCIVALHWLSFYGSIKLANASVALICMATTSIFTSIIEPYVMKTKVQKLEIILGVLIIPGMALIVDSLDFSMTYGLIIGMTSAFLAALFSTLNKKYIDKFEPLSITLVELSSACLFISIVFIVGNRWLSQSLLFPPSWKDWVYIILLSLLCTTLAYLLSLRALKHLSAYASNLVINLEPLYGILLAAVLLNESEQLNTRFYIGGGFIMAVVLSYPFIKKINKKT